MTQFYAFHVPIKKISTGKNSISYEPGIFHLMRVLYVSFCCCCCSFDSNSKVWSTEQIDGVRDAKCIVSANDELYFIGCGFDRTAVRSYHIDRKQWTERGSFWQAEHKATGIKAITLNESIYVVMCMI